MIDFNPPAKRPYVIVAPSYDPMTESTRVLHELCHALNLAGAPAYIAPAAYNGALYVLTDNGQLICIR